MGEQYQHPGLASTLLLIGYPQTTQEPNFPPSHSFLHQNLLLSMKLTSRVLHGSFHQTYGIAHALSTSCGQARSTPQCSALFTFPRPGLLCSIESRRSGTLNEIMSSHPGTTSHFVWPKWISLVNRLLHIIQRKEMRTQPNQYYFKSQAVVCVGEWPLNLQLVPISNLRPQSDLDSFLSICLKSFLSRRNTLRLCLWSTKIR